MKKIYQKMNNKFIHCSQVKKEQRIYV